MSEGVMTGELAWLEGSPVRIVRGREGVLAWKDQLVELSRRSGPANAMTQLEHDLARPAFARKRPTLILTMGRGADGADELQAAVLLYEHLILGAGCRLFFADYHGATRTVIAPEDERARAAFIASEFLMQQGALLVHISYEGEQPRMDAAGRGRRTEGRRLTWAIRQRQTIGYVPVEATVDATLANLGKHTRRNLRYYRRRAEADLGQELIDHPELTRDEFVAFNRICSYPLTDEQALRRHEALQHMPSKYLYLGLRTATGDWLSLIGGRIHEGNTHIEWQMNRADMPSYSLCTLMRSHLIEHEVKCKTRRIYFVGGTSHSIRTAMVPEVKIADLVVLHYKLPRKALCRMARPDSFAREMLSNTALEWHRWWRIPALHDQRGSSRKDPDRAGTDELPAVNRLRG
jgi:hypothetical protein